ncbi:MAG: hypothetical protein NC133_04365 [Prevotella sp.]|nr:hypothetical protein [Prevotella sp.]
MKNKKYWLCVITILACVVIIIFGCNFGQAPDAKKIVITLAQAGNESAAFEWQEKSAEQATVYFRQSGADAYTRVDDELIRQVTADTARVDIMGLQVGTEDGRNYDFKIVASTGATRTLENINITAYDRSGFAHFHYTDGVGAYQDDGSPKDGAVIVYVNESNKNTVQASINGKVYTGLVDILKHAGGGPLIVRIVGTIGAPTWHRLEYNEGKAITPEQVKGVNGVSLLEFYPIERRITDAEIPQEQLIQDGFNSLDTSVYCELNGLRSIIKYKAIDDEFSSHWNDCRLENIQNVTLEGVGTDARIYQWGMTFKNCHSIEVRNLTFEAYPEDACSADSDEKNTANTLDDFHYGRIWIHHNTFEKGANNWCVNTEHDKHNGDGSTDLKGIKNLTVAYNLYNYTSKTGIIGGGKSQMTANVTIHHNVYHDCGKRLPLANQANVHLYNNYYLGSTCRISLRANAYALIENCYFEDNNCSLELQHNAPYGDGWAKIVNCEIDESKILVYDGVDKSTNLYVGNDRSKQLNTSNQFGSNFDTSTIDFYYDGQRTDVTVMLTAQEVKEQLPDLVGVMKRVANVTEK